MIDTLDLENCPITDLGIEDLKNLTFLKSLTFDRCALTGKSFVHLSKLPLQFLSLVNCHQLEDQSIAYLTSSPILTTLLLGNCQKLTNTSLALLPSKLIGLDISYSKNIDSSGLAFLKRCPNLNILNVTGCTSLKDPLSHLTPLSLKGLDLQGCTQISDDNLLFLSFIPTLKFLSLGCGMPITDKTVDHILDLKNVEFLSFWWSDITDAHLQKLSSLSKLKTIALRGCKDISDSGLNYFKDHPALQNIDIRDCPLLTQSQITHFQQYFKGKVLF